MGDAYLSLECAGFENLRPAESTLYYNTFSLSLRLSPPLSLSLPSPSSPFLSLPLSLSLLKFQLLFPQNVDSIITKFLAKPENPFAVLFLYISCSGGLQT